MKKYIISSLSSEISSELKTQPTAVTNIANSNMSKETEVIKKKTEPSAFFIVL